ncbi:MAG: GatB/YqeY domain-containing protein [Proteobacteria bacterium]|nr:GatB/YqeY domain-containing protein [Pseudomonadota bacterium]
MSLAEKINIDLRNALKAGDKKLLAVSRNVLSELKNLLIRENLSREISNVSDDSFQKVIKTIVKQKNETKEYLVHVNDQEKIDIINYDLLYLESFMLKYLSDKETEDLIKKYISENNFEKKDFGKLMSLLKSNQGNEIDLSKAAKFVNSLLN